jgi:hypothetical protein
MRLAVAEVILERFRNLQLSYPELSQQQVEEIEKARQILTSETHR